MEQDETYLTAPPFQRHPRDPANRPLDPASIKDKRENRKSLRVRPSEILENAEPPSPLNLSFKSAPPQRAPTMSLFNLFSRPKVEKTRGYTERGLNTPTTNATRKAAASTPNLVAHGQQIDDATQDPALLSPQTPATKSTSKIKFKEPPPRAPYESKTGPFEPPPLFQAYPQATKDGTLEVSTMSVEAILQKSKHKKGAMVPKGAVDGLGEETLSVDTKRGPRPSLRHVAHGSSTYVELPRKIFVLVTSGYLLQYAETGPSDRLPEKMLHLGKESAAFACDLVPGKHYVLQVSQAVDQEGVLIANGGSIFSKLGIRSAAAKRMTSSFLLVMPNAREMESWMTSIRQEIEYLGGKKIVPDPVAKPKTSDAAEKLNELKKSPSHRYQIKRNPSKVANVTSPTRTTFQVPSPKVEADKSDSDTATIDGIEIEASQLDKEGEEAAVRNRAISDAPSMTSSGAVSVEQQQLNNVRTSMSNSNRTSHTSQTGTVATTVGTSRANSLVGSPPSPQVLTPNMEMSKDGTTPLKSVYRPMASHSVNRRRSAAPLPTPREGEALPALNTSPSNPRHSTIVESPVDRSTPPLPITTSPPKHLTATKSEPNLQGSLTTKEKHDSKIPSTPPVPAIDIERPVSLVGDLPPTPTWSSHRQPNRRTSTIQTSPNQGLVTGDEAALNQRTSMIKLQADRAAGSPPSTTAMPENSRSKRVSFSMPLKVNPSLPHGQTQPIINRRTSLMQQPNTVRAPPIVHTLTAKVDASNRVSISPLQSSSPLSSQGAFERPPSAPPTGRLSLFPSQLTPPTRAAPKPPKRSSSSAFAHSSTTPPQVRSQVQPDGRTLRRPASMQVRSDHAPFLSSVRNSTGPPTDVRAAPIRGMKPSRSASNVTTLAHSPDFNAFRGLKFDTPTLSEDGDKATPLLSRSASPLPPRPGSRSSVRRSMKPRSSLPELDFGIPVVGLGPPAPPPSAPLPAPPPASRTTSPTPLDNHGPGIGSVAGLGIRVS